MINSHYIFSLILAVFITFNSFHLFLETKKVCLARQRVPFYFYGSKFKGLNQFLQETTVLGFYTDKNLADKNHAAQYAQAQYALAPLILDLDYSKHAYILFDCTSEDVAMKTIQKMGLVPLKRNQLGVVLAKKKK